MSRRRALPRSLAHAAIWAAAAAALTAVFASYFRPSLAVDLASRLWSCL